MNQLRPLPSKGIPFHDHLIRVESGRGVLSHITSTYTVTLTQPRRAGSVPSARSTVHLIHFVLYIMIKLTEVFNVEPIDTGILTKH